MRECSKCGILKPDSEYFIRDKSTGRLHAQCKLCYAVHRKTYSDMHYQKYRADYLRRAKIRLHRLRLLHQLNMITYMQGKRCVDCGEPDMVVLEFDHIDPKTKSFNISQAVKENHDWQEVLNELKKCEVVCANCHKRRTAKQFKWYKANYGGTGQN